MVKIENYESEWPANRPPNTPNELLVSGHLERIAQASPRIAAQLPEVMRKLADDLEAISKSAACHQAEPNQQEVRGVPEHESLSHMLASQISAAVNIDPMAYDNLLHRRSALHTDKPFEHLQPSLTGADSQAGESRMHLRLLGTPEITLDGVRLNSVERCTRAALILYVLALHRGGLSGQRMVAHLISEWEDIDAFEDGALLSPSAHRHRTFIWRLRKLSGMRNIVVAHCERGGRENRYMLPGSTTCDVWDFEDRLDEAARLVVRANFDKDAVVLAAAARQEAIQLYRGDFCQGVGSGSLARAAGYLRRRYLHAVLTQAVYWRNRAQDLSQNLSSNQQGESGSKLAPDVENAWLEALSNYNLAAYVEPYEDSAYAGIKICQTRLNSASRNR